MATSDGPSDPEKVRLQAIQDILKHCAPKLSETDITTKLKHCKNEMKRQKDAAQIDKNCLINDAIYGPVELTPLMYKIINTSEFHRLKDIKQLGAAHYVYPGANHTRFDHSIGVCHLAKMFGEHLKQQLSEDTKSMIVQADPDWEKLWIFADKELLCVQLAGLCHDLGHGLYSHMYEYFGIKKDDYSVGIFKLLLVENTKVLVEFAKAGLGKHHVELIEWMIQPDKLPVDSEYRKREFLFEIVYNRTTGIDIDKWDRYERDCHYLGVTSDFQWRRCMHLGAIVKDEDKLRIAFRDKQLGDVYGMYRTGVILHQKAYHHKTVEAVEEMTSDAFKEIYYSLKFIQGRHKQCNTVNTLRARDDDIDGPKSMNQAIDAANNDNLEWYLPLTDSIIGMIKYHDLSRVANGDKESLENARELLRRIERRDLYHMAATVRIPKMYSILPTDDHLREKNAIWKAAWDALRDPKSRNEVIYQYLDEETKGIINAKDIWISLINFKLPPDDIQQEVINGHNPAEDVLFYRKREANKETELLSAQDVKLSSSLLVVPQAFVEAEVRIYDKRPTDQRTKKHQTALKDALLAWKENLAESVQHHQEQHQADEDH